MRKEVAALIWMISHSIPFKALDCPHWDTFAKEANITLRGRNSFFDTLLPGLHQLVLEDAHSRLKLAESVAVSFDGWTAAGTSGRMIGVIYHHIDSDWRYHNDLLDLIAVEAAQTGSSPGRESSCRLYVTLLSGELLKAVLQPRIFQHLGKDTLLSATVTDNGSNCMKASNLLSHEPWPCMAHTAQLAVRDVIGTEGTDAQRDLLRVKVSLVLC